MKAHQELDPTEGVPVGRDPRVLTVAELESLGHQKRPLLQAIRQNCIDCCAGSPAEVRRCGMVACVMWPYRMGSNPFHTRELTEEQHEAARVRGLALRPQHGRQAENSGLRIQKSDGQAPAATPAPADAAAALAVLPIARGGVAL